MRGKTSQQYSDRFSHGITSKTNRSRKNPRFKLRDKQLHGLKFRRQEPIGNFVVDFVCFENKSIMEIDGNPHRETSTKEHDVQRSLWLQEQGFTVLRFWSGEIESDIVSVSSKIQSSLQKISHPHLASPIKGEE